MEENTGEKEKILSTSIISIPHSAFFFSMRNINFRPKLLSANAFNLDKSLFVTFASQGEDHFVDLKSTNPLPDNKF